MRSNMIARQFSFYVFLFTSFQVKEMEITRSVAERTLRVHNGNVVNALIALTN